MVPSTPNGRSSLPASSSSTRIRRTIRSPPPPASSSSTPPAWPSTSPTTTSDRRCPSGSRRASPTRRLWDRTAEEVSAAGHEQPPALGSPLAARRRHLAPGDRDLQDAGRGRLSVPPPLDESAGCRGPRGSTMATWSASSTSGAAVLAGAYVTERIMPGAVGMDHGAKFDPIVPGEFDRGGVSTRSCRATPPRRTRRHGGQRLSGRGGEGRSGSP